MRKFFAPFFALAFAALMLVASGASAAEREKTPPPPPSDYQLSAGDTIRILVFQNPDLTLETRLSEGGTISYPLIGLARLGGLTLDAAERQIAKQLKEGGFVQQPQVTIVLVMKSGSQVSVLGQVNRPGRYPLESTNMRLTEMLATAGGIASTGDDRVVVTGTRAGKVFLKEVDVPGLFLSHNTVDDIVLAGGDAIYVHRAAVFYVYGEAQRPGAYRIERNMTVRQAIAQGGGPTQRGAERDPRLHRRNPDGTVQQLTPAPGDLVQPDDVIYVRESLF
jgi:polysaccharide export outer membrane protein